MKQLLTITGMALVIIMLSSYDVQSQNEQQFPTCDYAYVRVEGQIDRNMSVEVDLGKSEKANSLEKMIEDEIKGYDYESYVQILQYFLNRDYKLEKIMDQVFMSSSGGGSEGIAYIFKRPGANKSGD